MAKKILVIDDSALMRRVISDIINEGNEYEVAAIAKDGLEGFDLIVSNPNLYSAIILDINMPKMNGLELLQKLQKNHIEQMVLSLTHPSFLPALVYPASLLYHLHLQKELL